MSASKLTKCWVKGIGCFRTTCTENADLEVTYLNFELNFTPLKFVLFICQRGKLLNKTSNRHQNDQIWFNTVKLYQKLLLIIIIQFLHWTQSASLWQVQLTGFPDPVKIRALRATRPHTHAAQDVQDPGDYKRALVSMFALQTLIERSGWGAAIRLDRKGGKKMSCESQVHKGQSVINSTSANNSIVR